MTTALAGCNGAISGTPNPGDVGSEVIEWEATIESELLEATSYDSNCDQEWVEGVQSGSGSFTAIGTPPIKGAVTGLTLDVGPNTGDYRISGNAIINSIQTTVPVKGDVVKYACNFSFTGAITIGTVP